MTVGLAAARSAGASSGKASGAAAGTTSGSGEAAEDVASVAAPVLVVHAHPHPDRSIACRALLEAVRDAPGVAVHALYDRYPDHDIDVARERAALAGARLLVWLHPFTWYGAPSLLRLWIEAVLGHGWAYGAGGTAVAGKHCLWAVTTGAPAEAYAPDGEHGHPFEAFVPGMRQIASFCGMHWLPPLVVHGAHRVPPSALAAAGADLRARIVAYARPTAAAGVERSDRG